MLNSLLPLLIVAHVLFGVIALVVGFLAMRTTKNKKRHGLFGRAYGLTMGISIIFALLLLTIQFNFFLTMIAVLSIHQLITGYRGGKRKYTNPVNALDWSVTALGAGMSLAYLVWNVLMLSGVMPKRLPDVFLYMGIGFSLFVGRASIEEFLFYRRGSNNPSEWIIFHFGRMQGSYIALVTAAIVTTAAYVLPEKYQWLTWSIPPALGGVMATLYAKRYRARLSSKASLKMSPADSLSLKHAS